MSGGARKAKLSHTPPARPALRPAGAKGSWHMGRLVLDGACTGSIASKIVFVMFVFSFGFRGGGGVWCCICRAKPEPQL